MVSEETAEVVRLAMSADDRPLIWAAVSAEAWAVVSAAASSVVSAASWAEVMPAKAAVPMALILAPSPLTAAVVSAAIWPELSRANLPGGQHRGLGRSQAEELPSW